MGVDGLRLDAVPYLYEREGTNCENLPETHEYLKKLRAHIDAKFPGRMLLAEANQWPEDAVAYFGKGDESHMNFHFPLMPRMFMSLQMEDRFPIIDILDQTPAIPENCQWAMFLRNHDELTLEMVTDEERDYMWRVYATDPTARINLGIRRRLAPLLANSRRKIELLNILLFSMPGTPVLYYGDEIGMGDNFYLGDRNGCRTPMQWSRDRNAGFSKANPQQLYLPITIDPEYHYEAINVENQQKNLSSLLWWMRRVIAMRKNFKAFSRGSLEFLHPENPKVLAFLRRFENETILVVVNLSRFSQAVELDLSRFAGCVLMEVFSQNYFPAIRKAPYVITLGPHAHFWFAFQSQAAKRATKKRVVPAIEAEPNLSTLLHNDQRARLEREILPGYLRTCRWFGAKARSIREMRIIEADPGGGGRRAVVVPGSRLHRRGTRHLLAAGATRNRAGRGSSRAGNAACCHRPSRRQGSPVRRHLGSGISGETLPTDGERCHPQGPQWATRRAGEQPAGAGAERQSAALPGAQRRAEQLVDALRQQVFPEALPQAGGRGESRCRGDAVPD